MACSRRPVSRGQELNRQKIAVRRALVDLRGKLAGSAQYLCIPFRRQQDVEARPAPHSQRPTHRRIEIEGAPGFHRALGGPDGAVEVGDPPADEDHVLKVVSQSCQRRQ